MPPKMIDRGKNPSGGPNQEKFQTPNTSKPKPEPETQPWITITKKNQEKEEKTLQTPEEILEQMRSLQQAFEKSFSKQEEGGSSKTPSSLAISEKPEASFKMISRQNQASKQISKPLNNSQIVLKEFSQNPSSEYFEKPTYQNVITIEKDFFVENDPFITIEKFFGKNQFYKPYNTEKTVLFYQTILDITGSVSFKHNFLDESHTAPAYSTFKIHDIISPRDWDYDLNDGIKFPETCSNLSCYEVPFNYWDYCQAWYNVFLIQSPKHKHTWLIFFDTTCNLSKSPIWFNQWWNNFGSVTNIFKPQINKSFQIFKTSFIPSDDEKRFPALALFHSKFHLPWVFSWTFDYSNDTIPIIRRRFKVKWWDKYRIPSNLYPSNIPEWIRSQNSKTLNPPPPQKLIQTPEMTLFLAQKSKMLSMLAAAKSEEEIKSISMRFLPTISTQASQASGSEPDLDEDDL